MTEERREWEAALAPSARFQASHCSIRAGAASVRARLLGAERVLGRRRVARGGFGVDIWGSFCIAYNQPYRLLYTKFPRPQPRIG